ncbi:unnamed protein product [Protopolystoma xenopodis]|uniref:Uncharacterized protein n=1 Tax=Protopolystoma xenopodis TaxID=117903 RepID=A0A448XHG7_9PLAT|nr:unnamed protein product [Protopolystoma xenopodis]
MNSSSGVGALGASSLAPHSAAFPLSPFPGFPSSFESECRYGQIGGQTVNGSYNTTSGLQCYLRDSNCLAGTFSALRPDLIFLSQTSVLAELISTSREIRTQGSSGHSASRLLAGAEEPAFSWSPSLPQSGGETGAESVQPVIQACQKFGNTGHSVRLPSPLAFYTHQANLLNTLGRLQRDVATVPRPENQFVNLVCNVNPIKMTKNGQSLLSRR